MLCQTDREREREKLRGWLRVNSAMVRRRCQQLGGKEMRVEEKREMKWFFPVRI
jgi:hypothetical protein